MMAISIIGMIPHPPMMENIFLIFWDIRPLFETWLKKMIFYPKNVA